VAPGVLDATRCISYLTIELRGSIPEPLQSSIGTHVYGCDVCQEVCPWNAVAPVSPDPAWQPRPAWDRATVTALSSLGDEALEQALDGSAMSRAGTTGLRRNLRAASRNLHEARGD
jgi:epoxyqueuosine reductase